jgi:hypothetical protein
MAQLLSFKESVFSELADSEVESISAVFIYYVFTGRNAWHSTWVTQYSEGCMHTNLESAKQYAEKRRTQGTVFHIKELPALLFNSKCGCLAVTQINSHNPLSSYSPNATTLNVGLGVKKIDGALENYICKHAPMLGVALSFAHGSRFWLMQPPPKNSVITVATSGTADIFSELPEHNLSIKTSFSHGGNYRLGWSEKESGILKLGVRNILAGPA